MIGKPTKQWAERPFQGRIREPVIDGQVAERNISLGASMMKDGGCKSTPSAIVVGGGFGGIAAALRLRAKGWQVTLLDRAPMLGGRALFPAQQERAILRNA